MQPRKWPLEKRGVGIQFPTLRDNIDKIMLWD